MVWFIEFFMESLKKPYLSTWEFKKRKGDGHASIYYMSRAHHELQIANFGQIKGEKCRGQMTYFSWYVLCTLYLKSVGFKCLQFY